MIAVVLAGAEGAAQDYFLSDAIAADSSKPAGLIYFNAVGMPGSAVLTWAAGSRAKNTKFEIERSSSEDGDWLTIGVAETTRTAEMPKRFTFTDREVPAEKMWYRLKQVDRDGNAVYSQSIEVSTAQPPEAVTLGQNYPNPFNPTTTIAFDLPVESFIRLNVYDALGQEVASLINAVWSAGHHAVTFDGSRLNAGIYLYRLDAGSFSQVKRMILLK